MNELEQKRILQDWLRTHRGLLTKVLRAYAFQTHDQQDLYQEIAFQLWKSIPNFQGQSMVSTWVYRVALYSGIEWSRKERRRKDKQADLELALDCPNGEALNEDPRVSWLYGRIARLEPLDRSLMLLLLEGQSYSEMADTLGVSISNVGVKISRIKQAMAADPPREHHDGI
jgi:RNA polymerase sigma-70 factor (ECF subfamily)